MNIEDRIYAINAAFLTWNDLDPNAGIVMGTALQQVMLHPEGLGWTLAVGRILLPKVIFVGPTIETVMRDAEKFFNVNDSRVVGELDIEDGEPELCSNCGYNWSSHCVHNSECPVYEIENMRPKFVGWSEGCFASAGRQHLQGE